MLCVVLIEMLCDAQFVVGVAVVVIVSDHLQAGGRKEGK